MTARINTSDAELHALDSIIDKARPGTANVTVPKEALRRLLLDHFQLLDALRERRQLIVTAGADQGSLL